MRRPLVSGPLRSRQARPDRAGAGPDPARPAPRRFRHGCAARSAPPASAAPCRRRSAAGGGCGGAPARAGFADRPAGGHSRGSGRGEGGSAGACGCGCGACAGRRWGRRGGGRRGGGSGGAWNGRGRVGCSAATSPIGPESPPVPCDRPALGGAPSPAAAPAKLSRAWSAANVGRAGDSRFGHRASRLGAPRSAESAPRSKRSRRNSMASRWFCREARRRAASARQRRRCMSAASGRAV